MKKLLYVIVATLLIIFTGCSKRYQFDLDHYENNVTSILIIEVEDSDLEKLTIIKEIEASNTIPFLHNLNEIEFNSKYGVPVNKITGKGILLTFKDNSFQLFSWCKIEKYDSNKKKIEDLYFYSDKSIFDKFLEKYL